MAPKILSNIFQSRNGHRWVFWDFFVGFAALFLAMTITPGRTLTYHGLLISVSIVYGLFVTIVVRLCGVTAPGRDYSYSLLEMLFAAAIGTAISFFCIQFIANMCLYHFGRTIVATILAITFFGVIFPRWLASSVVKIKSVNIALYPSGENANFLKERLEGRKSFKVAGVFCDSKYTCSQTDNEVFTLQDKSKAEISQLLRDKGIDLVVLCETADVPKETYDILVDLPLNGIDILSKGAFVETYFREISLDYANLHWMASHRSLPGNTAIFSAKRVFDFCIALAATILTLPLWPLIAIAIRLDSKGSPLFIQKRIGMYGREFDVYKFRTMVDKAEEKGAFWTVQNDDRITKLGAFLRKSRLDELPQLINIMKGDMSIVGPRPEAVALGRMYEEEIPYYHRRYLVPPGLTGWAQICYKYGASVDDAKRKLEFDLYYIRHLSLMFDIQIMIKTIPSMMKGSR